MTEYTVKNEVVGFIEVMKSKFTAFVFPTTQIEEFNLRLEQIRKANPKARHIVYAYRIGVNSKSTDDKEPKGTAGRPLLELLNKKNLKNVAIIVVRYYGGTLLGAGRLLRAYVNSAVSAIEKAELIEL